MLLAWWIVYMRAIAPKRSLSLLSPRSLGAPYSCSFGARLVCLTRAEENNIHIIKSFEINALDSKLTSI